MITSPDNEKLKLIRKLRQRKHRDREGLFVTEGEDLARTGLAAGVAAAGTADPSRPAKEPISAKWGRRSSRICWTGPPASVPAAG